MGGYLYPWPSARCPQIAPFQLIYSSFTDGFRVKLQGERCINLTFSRIHVLHARLIPSKVQQPSSGLYLVVGSFGLRGPWLVPPSKVGSLSKPSVGTFVTEGYLPRPFEGLVLLACAPERAVASFGPPKVGSLAWGDLVSDCRPSGVLAFLRWSAANELGSIFDGGIDLRESTRRSNPQQ